VPRVKDPTKARGKRTNPLEILLIEDNEADRQILVEILSGCEIEHSLAFAEDGYDAMMMLRAEGKPPPDFLFLDLNLPRKNGYEVLEELQEDADLGSIPILVLSTSSSELDKAKCRSLGAVGYLSKPTGIENFDATLKAIEIFLKKAKKGKWIDL
jgi:two-component system, chemotaxis family, response regulator Rcp1